MSSAIELTNEQIVEAIGRKPLMEVVELVKLMEEKFEVSAAIATMAMPAGGGATAAPAVEEQTEFTLVLANFGEKKVEVIKIIRALTGLGLKEAKDLVESAPVNVKESITKEEAEKMKKQIEEVGGKVDIK